MRLIVAPLRVVSIDRRARAGAAADVAGQEAERMERASVWRFHRESFQRDCVVLNLRPDGRLRIGDFAQARGGAVALRADESPAAK
jgi:hypothetical protein